MRALLLLALIFAATPASAQYLVPLATPDGQVGCTQGMTGIGRPQHWEAVQDADAPGGWALAETTGDTTDLHFPFCVAAQAATRDFDATLRFKIVSGTRQQAAGLMFRARDATDYFVARVSARDGTVKLYRILGGRRSQLASTEAAVETGKWYALRVLVSAGRIEVWLDGASRLVINDNGPLWPGAIGVWTQSDSLVHFGSLLVGPPP